MANGMIVPVPSPPAQPPRVGLLPTFRALDEQADRFAGNDDDDEGRAAAQYVLESGAGWEHGFSFAPEQCLSSGRGSWDCDQGDAQVIDANPAIVSTRPFFVGGADKCSPFDKTRDFRGRAERMLEASKSFQIANELWTGALAKVSTDPDGSPWPNIYLAHASADVLNEPTVDTPMEVIDALGCLEYALGLCQNGGRGVIHCTRQLATEWNRYGALRREGNMLLSALDTIIVADAGYDGSGPAGQAAGAGTQWAYATGLVQIRLGPVRHPTGDPEIGGLESFNSPSAQRFNPATNLIEYRVNQDAAVVWDGCCHLAVNVNLPLCYSGGTS